MQENSRKVLFVSVLISTVNCFLFHNENYVKFQEDDKYFGYSVFLQGGAQNLEPTLVVGAPGNLNGRVFTCALSSTKCKGYNKPKSGNMEVFNSSLFGAAIDGDTAAGEGVVICAPKTTYHKLSTGKQQYYPRGSCYYLEDIVNNEHQWIKTANGDNLKMLANNVPKYYNAFAESGFSVHYKDHKNVIMGGPGFFDWKGDGYILVEENVPIQTRATHPYLYDTVNIHQDSNPFQSQDYAGYSVAIADFNRDHMSYVLGAPRANGLCGAVYVTNSETTLVEHTLLPDSAECFGSYFGASLTIADVNGDGFDDLLVGAPTHTGKKGTYNDGLVYQFINNGEGYFDVKYMLEVNDRSGQFGTAMSNLGKVALNQYDVVAISAPYANNGNGAIYISIGSPSGLQAPVQKINRNEVQSFGFSLSKPVDIDNNNVQDLAVGAYKSNSAFVLKARRVFKYEFNTKTAQSIQYDDLSSGPRFNVEYCVKTGLNVENVKFIYKFDSRIERNNYNETGTINENACFKLDLKLQKNTSDINPVKITVNTLENDCPTCPVSSPAFSRSHTLSIPIIYDCGDDQICNPILNLESSFYSGKDNSWIVGDRGTPKLIIKIRNEGEPAYNCKARVVFTNDESIIHNPFGSHQCILENCPFNPVIQKGKEYKVEMPLDFSSLNNPPEKLTYRVTTECVNYTIKSESYLPVKYVYKIEVDGSSDTVIYKNKNEVRNNGYSHRFNVRNRGPSPALARITFTLPHKFKSTNDIVFQIYEPKVHFDLQYTCTSTLNYYKDAPTQTVFNASSDTTIQAAQLFGSNKPDNIACGSDEDIICITITCEIHMPKGETTVPIELKVLPNTNLITVYYKNTFNVVANAEFKSTAESGESLATSTITLQDTEPQSSVAWYWIVLGVVCGIVLLAIVILVLYKFGFFQRTQREFLIEEKNKLQQNMELTQVNEATEEMKDD